MDTVIQRRKNKRGVWLLENFVLCMIPIFVSLIITPFKQVFPSIIAYCYTLLMVSLYLFDNYLKRQLDEDTYSDLKKACTWIVIFSFLIMYLLYHFWTPLTIFVGKYSVLSFAFIFLLTMAISFGLNKPIIEHSIAIEEALSEQRKIFKSQIDEADRMKEVTAAIKNVLKKERGRHES